MSHEPIYGQPSAGAPAPVGQPYPGQAPVAAPVPGQAPAPQAPVQAPVAQPQYAPEQVAQPVQQGYAPVAQPANPAEVYQPQVQSYQNGVPGQAPAQAHIEENNHFAPLPVAQPPEISQAPLANPEAVQYAQQVAAGQVPQQIAQPQYQGAPVVQPQYQAPAPMPGQGQVYPGQAPVAPAPQQYAQPQYQAPAPQYQAPVPGQGQPYPGQGQAPAPQQYAPGQSTQPYVNNATISATPTGHPLKTKFTGRGILVSVTTMDSKKGNRICRGLINAVPDDRNSKANNFICFSKSSSYQIDIIDNEQLRPNYTALTKSKGEVVLFEGSWEENNYNNQISIQLMVDKFWFESDPNFLVRAESYIPPLPPNPMDMLNGGNVMGGAYPGQAPIQGYPGQAPAPYGAPAPQQGYAPAPVPPVGQPQYAPAPQGQPYPGQAPVPPVGQPQYQAPVPPQGQPQYQGYPGQPLPQ